MDSNSSPGGKQAQSGGQTTVSDSGKSVNDGLPQAKAMNRWAKATTQVIEELEQSDGTTRTGPTLRKRRTGSSKDRNDEDSKAWVINMLWPGRGKEKTVETAAPADVKVEARRRFLFDDKGLRHGGLSEAFAANEPPIIDFDDIVDQDDQRIETFVSQVLIGRLLESLHFRFFILGLIVMNAILIALQTDEYLLKEYRQMFNMFDGFVLGVFTCELILKWYHGFWIFWRSGWDTADFFVVVCLLVGPQLTFLSSSRIIRLLRVIRAFRSLRQLSALVGISVVVQTILQSLPDMANIGLLLMIFSTMLGVAGVSLFGKEVPEHFGDLPAAIFSLFICMTQDGWLQIYHSLQAQGEDWRSVCGTVYICFSILIGAFIFANLVVAIVVTNLEMAMLELRREKKRDGETLSQVHQLTEEMYNMDDQDSKEKLPTVEFHEATKGINLAYQTPLETPDLKHVSTEQLERYFMVLIALEENFAEYLTIKNDLSIMFENVRELNSVDDLGMAEEEDQSERVVKDSTNDLTLNKGDVLSAMMTLMQQYGVNEVNTMDDVIKGSTRKYTGR